MSKLLKWSEAVNDYYQLKRVYEEERMRLVKESSASKEKKKLDLKVPCVDCGNTKGTKFEIYYDKEKDGRMLTAVCGNVVDPCSLDIKIFCGCTETYGSLISSLEKEITDLKQKIIDEKNKLLFGFISSESAVDKFDKYKKDLAELTERLTSVLELYMQETDNREVKEAIQKANEDICKEVYNIKNMVQKFDSSGDLQFIKDAVDLYQNKVSVKLRQLTNLKFAYQDVIFDDSTGTYTLVQKRTTLEQMEITLQDNKVLSFTFKEKGSVNENKNKNKKVLKKGSTLLLNEMEIVSDALNLNKETQKEKESEENTKDKPLFTLNDEGKVIWSESDYASLWDELSKQMKQTLIQDTVWMEAALKSFVEKKREGKEIEFVLPPNLIIPPNEMPDGSYDLGNDFFNDIYSKIKSDLNVGITNDQLKEKLKQEASQQLNFTL